MASPHVAGAATLALAANPQLSADELRALLMLTSHDFNAASTCVSAWPSCGVGIVNAANMARAAVALKAYRTVVEFYNPDYGHYFRTGDRDEPALVESGAVGNWKKTEDHFVAWRDASSGAVPVCRMYNAAFRSHFYTANMADCDWLRQNTDWKFESIAFYAKLPVGGACPAGSRAVHRFYNNRQAANDGNHRFVTSREAFEAKLRAQGWTYEGVAFCAAA